MASVSVAFQKIVTEILLEIPGCFNLLNDIIVYGNTIQEHDEKLYAVSTRFFEHGVLFHVAKCDLGHLG